MKRFFCLLVALACLACLTQGAVMAQLINIDDGATAHTYVDITGQHVGELGFVNRGIVIDANVIAGSEQTPSAIGAVDINGTTVNLNGATNIVGATGVTGTITATGLVSGVGLDAGAGAITGGAVTSTGLVSGVGLDAGGAGITNAGAISGATTITATGLVSGVGLDAGGAGITNAGAISGATTITATGLVSGLGLDAGGAGITNAGNISGAGTITASGLITGDGIDAGTGQITGNGGASIYSPSGSDWIYVNDGVVDLGNDYSGLTIEDSAVSLVSSDEGDVESVLQMDPTTASLKVNTWYDDGEGGQWVGHGLDVYETYTTLSGGTNSTTLLLDDDGAYFDNDLEVDGDLSVYGDTYIDGSLDVSGIDNNGYRITGVDDGINPMDAVNRRQLDGLDTRLSAGIASIAALSAIPAPICGKNSCVGVGYGNYNGESAFAVGAKVNIPDSNVSLAAGMGFSSSSSPAANAGVSFSF